MSSSVPEAFSKLAETIRLLVADDGCAWHNVQTHQTLIRYLIEESSELVEAIETGGAPEEVQEELADLLYQVCFHAALAEKHGEGYDLASVADLLNAKLIARHPHVFSDRGYMSVEELNAEWEQLKADASGQQRGILEGIAVTMPTLARAEKIVDRLERAGLADSVLGSRVRQSANEMNADPVTVEEFGREMMALLRVAHANGVNVDEAMRATLREVTDRVVNEGAE